MRNGHRFILSHHQNKEGIEVVLCATVLASLLPQDLFLPVCTQFVYFCCCFCVFFMDFFSFLFLPFLLCLFSFITYPTHAIIFLLPTIFIFSFVLFGEHTNHLLRHYIPRAVIAHDSDPRNLSQHTSFICLLFVWMTTFLWPINIPL